MSTTLLVANLYMCAGQKTMWAAAKADIAQACRDCDTGSKMRPKPLPETTAHLARGHSPRHRWQVDFIGPLPPSEGLGYALICVRSLPTQAIL